MNESIGEFMGLIIASFITGSFAIQGINLYFRLEKQKLYKDLIIKKYEEFVENIINHTDWLCTLINLSDIEFNNISEDKLSVCHQNLELLKDYLLIFKLSMLSEEQACKQCYKCIDELIAITRELQELILFNNKAIKHNNIIELIKELAKLRNSCIFEYRKYCGLSFITLNNLEK